MDSLDLATSAVEAGAVELLGPVPGKPRAPGDVREKGAHDYQTDLDVRIERIIARLVRGRFPEDGFVGEEVFSEASALSRVWYLDPVDGTRNLVDGRPDIAVSLGLLIDGRPFAGAIALPCRGIVVSASAAGELRLNRAVLAPPAPRPLSRALVAIPGDVAQAGQGQALVRLFAALSSVVEGIRISGAIAYDIATMALGEVHGRVSFAPKPVDVAAGLSIVAAIGGLATDLDGRPYVPGAGPIVVGATAEIHGALLEAARDAA